MRLAVDDSLICIQVVVFREDSVTLDLSVLELSSVDKLMLEVIESPISMWHCIEISLVVQNSGFVHDSLALLIASWIPLTQVVVIIQPMFLENEGGEELLIALHNNIRTFFGLELLESLLKLCVLGPGRRLIVGDSCGLDVLSDRRAGDCQVVADCTH